MTGIRSLMVGDTGTTGCKVPKKRFHHTPERVERLGANAASHRPYPFNIRDPRSTDGEHVPGDLTSGSYMRRAHELDLVIAYGNRPQQQLSLQQIMQDDEELLARVLEYEPNVALTSNWTGCKIIDTRTEDAGATDPPPLRLLYITIEVSHRERRLDE